MQLVHKVYVVQFFKQYVILQEQGLGINIFVL